MGNSRKLSKKKWSRIVYVIFFIGALIIAAMLIAKYEANSFVIAVAALLLFASGYLLMSNIQEDIGKKYEDRYNEELDATYTASQQDYIPVDEQLVELGKKIDQSNSTLLDELDELATYAKLHRNVIFKNYNEMLKDKLACIKELVEECDLKELKKNITELREILRRTIE